MVRNPTGKNHYDKKTKLRARKAYLKTLNCGMTAQIVGCSHSTIKRWRDTEGWVDKAVVRRPDNGRALGLTADIALRLVAGWQKLFDDKTMCALIGIEPDTLKTWLVEDSPVTYPKTTTMLTPDGLPMLDGDGQPVTQTTLQTDGLRTLRTRAWAGFEYGLVQKIVMLIDKATIAGDLRVAIDGCFNLLAKKMPLKYGSQPAKLNVNISEETHNTIKIDEMNFTDEQRKGILSKVIEQIEGAKDEP